MARRKRRSRPDPRLVEVYENIEAIYAKKGRKSHWPNKPFEHKFGKGASVYGVKRGGKVKLRKGDLVVRSKKGKRLWKYFTYR